MKKNVRQVPPTVRHKLQRMSEDEIVVACAKTFSRASLEQGVLRHLGVELTATGFLFPTESIPPADSGRFSDWNVNGREIKRKDLPMEPYTISIESPNWGDWSNGSHTVEWHGERYPVEFQSPKELAIAIGCGNPQPGLSEYAMMFRVEEILNKKDKGFDQALFFNLNLLQENVGACGVEPARAKLQEYLRTLHVSWEILPPGSRDEALERIFRGRTPSTTEVDVAKERYDFFMSLKPKQLIYGTSGLRRYFGALLEDNLVVFENIRYGNAVYLLYENWKELSQRSRIELLSGRYGDEFNQVRHVTGWKGKVRELIKKKRGNGARELDV